MKQYLLTISAQQKKKFVSRSDINEVLHWLPISWIHANSFETSGKYGQLHYHAVVDYKGLWKPYVQYGDSQFMNLTFRIQWKKITNLSGAIEYVYKDTHRNSILQHQIIEENKYNYYYYNPDDGSFTLLSRKN